MIVAIPPTFCVAQKLFTNKTFLKKVRFALPFSAHTRPLCFGRTRSVGRPNDPYHSLARLLYMVVTVDCHCCSIMYSSCMSNDAGGRDEKKGMMKIKKKQSPVISFATFVSCGLFGARVFVYVCMCVCICSRIGQLCTYYLAWMYRSSHLG